MCDRFFCVALLISLLTLCNSLFGLFTVISMSGSVVDS